MSTPTQKDADQTLRYAFDDSTNAFRVEGNISATNPSVSPTGAPIPADATLVAGENPSGNLEPLQTDASGNLLVSLAAEPGAPLHVIVDSSALPTGASTSANQTTQTSALNTIIANQTNGTQTATVSVSNFPATVTVVQPTGSNLHADIDSSALPTGASTSANQTTANSTLASVLANQTNGTQVTSVSNFPPTQPVSGTVVATQSTASNLNATVSIAAAQTLANVTTLGTITNPLPTGTNALGSVSVSNFPSTQPVSGTVTVTQATGTNLHTVVDSSALPTGAATSANQTNGTQVTSVNNFPATQPVSATSLPLPTGASTSANQTSVIGPGGLGGTAATNSELAGAVFNSGPLALTNTQQAPLQLDTSGNLKITGTVGTTQSTTPWADNISQFGGSNVVTGTGVSGAGIPRVTVSSDSFPTTQAVSAVSLPLPTGASTSALQSSVQGSSTGGTAATSSILNGGIFNTTLLTLTNGQQASLQLNASGKLFTQSSIQPTSGTLTDNSGTTSATPSTSTTLMASNANRKYLLIQNVSSNTIWINFTSAANATQPSYQLLAGGSLVQESGFVSTEAITVLSTVASQAYTAKQA